MAKELTEEEQKSYEELMIMIGKSLLETMRILDAPNFIECTFNSEDADELYTLRFDKVVKKGGSNG